MNCADIRPLLSAYADGVLNAADRAAVEAELDQCPACQTALDRMQSALALLDRAEPIEMPSTFEAGFRARLDADYRRKRRRAVALAGAVALAAGLLIFAFWPRAQPATPPDAMIAQLELLQNYEVIEQLDDLLAAESVDDIEVIAALDALDAQEAP